MSGDDVTDLNPLPPSDGDWIRDDPIDEATSAILDNARVTSAASMDATRPLTGTEGDAIRERWAHAKNTQRRVTLTALSKSAAVPAGTLSQCLSGSHKGTVETVDSVLRKVDRWLADRQDKGDAPKLPGYVATGIVEQITGYVKLARETDSILVITGGRLVDLVMG